MIQRGLQDGNCRLEPQVPSLRPPNPSDQSEHAGLDTHTPTVAPPPPPRGWSGGGGTVRPVRKGGGDPRGGPTAAGAQPTVAEGLPRCGWSAGGRRCRALRVFVGGLWLVKG